MCNSEFYLNFSDKAETTWVPGQGDLSSFIYNMSFGVKFELRILHVT